MSDINLGSIVSNATARKVIYAIYAIAGLVLGGIQAWYGVIGDTPTWLAQYLAVYGYLGIPVGGLAIANTPKKPDVAEIEGFVLADGAEDAFYG